MICLRTAAVLAILVGVAAAQPTLTHGPVVGDPESSVASIWLRSSGPALASVVHSTDPGFGGSLESPAITLGASGNYCGRIDLAGLSAGTTHYYRLRLRDPQFPTSATVTPVFRFKTAPVAAAATDLTIGMVADIGNLAEYDLFADLELQNPDLVLFLGDWPYSDSSPAATTQAAYRQKHLDARAEPNLQSLLSKAAIAPIFDDHEILNDWDAGSDPSRVSLGRAAWLEAMPVRSPSGTVYRSLRYGAATEFFILDTRTYRGNNSAPDLPGRPFLGPAQWNWLQTALTNSTATFKFIVTSVPLRYGTTNKDHWQGYMRERQALFSWLQAQRLSNVIFLSGDQHWSAVHHHREGFLEFQACPLAAGLRAPPNEPEEEAGPIYAQRSFGVVRVLASATPPAVEIEFHGVNGLLHTHRVEAGAPAKALIVPPRRDAGFQLVGPMRFHHDGARHELARIPPGDYSLGWRDPSPAAALADALLVTVPPAGFLSVAAGTSPVEPNLLLAADFETSDLSVWTVVDEGTTDAPSAWFVDDHRLVQSSNIFGGSTAATAAERPGTDLVAGSAAWTDVTMRLRVRSDDDDGIGAVLRRQANGDGYRFLMDAQRQQARLVRRQGATWTILSEVVLAYEKARWCDLELQALGNSLQVRLDGVPILSATDNTFTQGRIALSSWGSQVVWFDRVRVYSGAAPLVDPTALLVEDWTSGSLAGWTVVDQGTTSAPSAWAVQGGVLTQSSNIHGGTLVATDPEKPGTFLRRTGFSAADFHFGARLRCDDNDAFGLMFRIVDSNNYYRFAMDSERNYRRLTKTVNGVTSILAETSGGFVPGAWMSLQIQAVGVQLTAILDGFPILTATDTSFATGGVGLYCWGAVGSQFDDVVVAPGIPAPSVLAAVGTRDDAQFLIRASAHAGRAYVLACAVDTAPGFSLSLLNPADSRVVPLAPDALFQFSLANAAPLNGLRGVLDNQGEGVGGFSLPPASLPAGFRFFVSGLILDANALSGVAAVLPLVEVTLP